MEFSRTHTLRSENGQIREQFIDEFIAELNDVELYRMITNFAGVKNERKHELEEKFQWLK